VEGGDTCVSLRTRAATLAPVPATPPLPAPDPDDHLDLRWRRAHLATSRLLTWPHPAADAPGVRHHLHVALDGRLRRVGDEVIGADIEVALHRAPEGLPAGLVDRDGARHLAGRPTFHLDVEVEGEWLAGQLVVTASDDDGRLLAATGVQTALAIDERFATDEPLGVGWGDDGRPTCRLWAPTARRVDLHLGAGPTGAPSPGRTAPAPACGEAQVLPLTRGPRGVWTVTGEPSWAGRTYRFDVEVYDPETDRVVRHLVTDPWSVGLTADSERSLLVDLGDLTDPALAPTGWVRGTTKPSFAGQARMVVYELHVRDFSAADPSVPAELRGTYAAFTLPGTHGVRHLRTLAEAGVTHLHLLPINDLASIPERREDQVTPSIEEPGDPASPEPQAIQQASVDHQAYNWGYDPLHWLVPEGAYASDPDGPARIREVRELVAGVNRLGLRVVVDVVFNHTYRAGAHPLSVLDRVVPGYFHRLDDLGRVTTSTCCPNTATEHAMMERLIVDAVVTWARAYRVDGFRFDLLGHHPAAQARRIRTVLDRLTLQRDGVDGRSIVLYGEGWEFGEVAGDARFVQATQSGLAGTGIGTFDDRLRDAVRGGSHVGPRSAQGFASGRWWEPNGRGAQGSDGGHGRDPADREAALELTDRVRLGVTGNLADIEVPCHDGVVRRGHELRYGQASAGTSLRPQDQVAYVSAHDNETLFDALAAKLPIATPMEDRVRLQVVALATVLLGQGTPFLHAGSELLRSKSLDRDSYRSGDWFNAIDWTASRSRWGVGLPPASSNPEERELLAELLRSIPAPEPHHLAACRELVLALLRVRRRSPLFGLPTTADVARHLTFHLTGAAGWPGQVVWSLWGLDRADHDLLLALNAAPEPLFAGASQLALDPDDPEPGRGLTGWRLHPSLADVRDPVLGRVRLDPGGLLVPPRTAAVLLRTDRRGPASR
jgi:pullulanase